MLDNAQPLFDLLLSEIRESRTELRGEIQAIRSELQRSNERVTAVEVGIRPLLPNGRPGKIAEMSDAIHQLEGKWKWCVGACAGVGAMVSVLSHFLK